MVTRNFDLARPKVPRHIFWQRPKHNHWSRFLRSEALHGRERDWRMYAIALQKNPPADCKYKYDERSLKVFMALPKRATLCFI